MKIVFISLIFLITPSFQQRQALPIHISVVRQKIFENHGHHPWFNRRVYFRLTNKSQKTVTVYGLDPQNDFVPNGYLIMFNKVTGSWEYPNNQNAPTPWNEVSELEKRQYLLPPGKTLSFTAEMDGTLAGNSFKRTVYISFRGGQGPFEVASDAFDLK